MTANRDAAGNEANYEIRGSGGESRDVSSGNPTNEWEGVSMLTSQDDTGDKVSRQPAPSEGRQGRFSCLVVMVARAYIF
jgi:hypothetical protein